MLYRLRASCMRQEKECDLLKLDELWFENEMHVLVSHFFKRGQRPVPPLCRDRFMIPLGHKGWYLSFFKAIQNRDHQSDVIREGGIVIGEVSPERNKIHPPLDRFIDDELSGPVNIGRSVKILNR